MNKEPFIHQTPMTTVTRDTKESPSPRDARIPAHEELLVEPDHSALILPSVTITKLDDPYELDTPQHVYTGCTNMQFKEQSEQLLFYEKPSWLLPSP